MGCSTSDPHYDYYGAGKDQYTRPKIKLGHNQNCCVLKDFADYCDAHPDERFWQALRNWSDQRFICAVSEPEVLDEMGVQDTFHWEGRDG